MGRSSENRASDADPLAQGMVLTAIVIMMGVAAFVLSLVYRLFVINRDDDDVEDDEEGREEELAEGEDEEDQDGGRQGEAGEDAVSGGAATRAAQRRGRALGRLDGR